MVNHRFSVVIPSLNEEVNLPILISSLAKQTYRDFEVIVTDCLSTDNTKKYVETAAKPILYFRFIQKKTKNVSAARNYGASQAKGDWLIFFDADVEVEADFLKIVNERINQYNLNMMTVWNRPKTNSFVGKLVLGLLNMNMTIFQKIKPAANGPCMIMQKTLFEKLKGFDDTIVFGEDFDITQRAYRSGATFAVFDKPILYVSSRRFEKEGFFLSLYKSLKAIAHQMFLGPIRKPIFEYEMGGQYYKKPPKK
ncbi:glycosyltransferase [Candidatus Roizmanbacteria bacterium]|jgi:hypothetical protein|nr:glycosyltransferase [Candidatus Roizmanbacteria bacterium]